MENKKDSRTVGSNLKNRKVYPPLSQKRRVALFIIFCAGIELSYPTILPLGLICASILLFQKNKKANLLGYFLLLVQVLSIYIFFTITNISA
jgi:hypothetical protein